MYRLARTLAAAVVALWATPAPTQSASDFPSRPVTLIVPTAASVSGDLLMRAFADAATKHLGQPVIVENKPGGSATLAAAYVAGNVKPDGYTITQIVIPAFRIPVKIGRASCRERV